MPVFPLNPRVFGPAGGSEFDPGAIHNSGVRVGPSVTPPPGFAAGETYSLNFNEEGTYTYLCSLHFTQGMVGTVTVGQQQSVAPPGVGGLVLTPMVVGAAALAGLCLLVTGVALIRRYTLPR